MKKLILIWIFSGSLDGFSQDIDTTKALRHYDPKSWGTVKIQMYDPQPDTLRCTLIVYYDKGPAILHTKPGFVVRGEREIYLDDKKARIKAPLEVFSYKLK